MFAICPHVGGDIVETLGSCLCIGWVLLCIDLKTLREIASQNKGAKGKGKKTCLGDCYF